MGQPQDMMQELQRDANSKDRDRKAEGNFVIDRLFTKKLPQALDAKGQVSVTLNQDNVRLADMFNDEWKQRDEYQEMMKRAEAKERRREK